MVNPVTVQPVSIHANTPLPNQAQQPSQAASVSQTSVPSAASAESQVGRANPSFQFDPAAGVVVIQFRNDSGKVDLSIPSPQQLNAYATDRTDGNKQPTGDAVIA